MKIPRPVNKLVPDDYELFVEALITATETDDMPIDLQLNDTSDISSKDISDFISMLKQDTGLDAFVTFFTCDECGMMHALIEINYPTEEDTPLQ